MAKLEKTFDDSIVRKVIMYADNGDEFLEIKFMIMLHNRNVSDESGVEDLKTVIENKLVPVFLDTGFEIRKLIIREDKK